MASTVRFKEVTRFSILFQHLTWSERANIKIDPAYRICPSFIHTIRADS